MSQEKPLQVTIEQSPYGDTGAVYEGMLGMTQHYRLQLISFRTQDKTPEEREQLEIDIKAYEEIIASKSQENATNFVRIKQESRRAGNGFKHNQAVIDHMKETGVWITTP